MLIIVPDPEVMRVPDTINVPFIDPVPVKGNIVSALDAEVANDADTAFSTNEAVLALNATDAVPNKDPVAAMFPVVDE